MSARVLVSVVVLSAASALANDAYLKAEVVDAVAAAPKGPRDAAWDKAPVKAFALAAQRTVHLHDKRANEVLGQPGSRAEVRVRAALAGASLELLLEWDDASRDVVREDEVNAFADSVAVQVPEKYGKGLRLPAISMGDEGAPVRVWLQRATKDGALLSSLVAAGFGSSTRQAPPAPTPGALSYDAAKKTFRAAFSIPVPADAALVPVAFAVWEGGRHERSGYKRLSSWHAVKLPGRAVDAAYLKELSWGYGPGELGDPAKGKPLVESLCATCHHVPGKTFAPRGLAPSLEAIGAIATPGYLRESILNPSAVILHAPNPNQHYDKGGARDPNGAFPNQAAFEWATKGADGKSVSKMPPFAQFEAQVGDLVAFLKTLDGESKP